MLDSHSVSLLLLWHPLVSSRRRVNTISYVDFYLWFFYDSELAAICSSFAPPRLEVLISFSFSLSFAAPPQSIFPFISSTQVALFIFLLYTPVFFCLLLLSGLLVLVKAKLKSSQSVSATLSHENTQMYIEEWLRKWPLAVFSQWQVRMDKMREIVRRRRTDGREETSLLLGRKKILGEPGAVREWNKQEITWLKKHQNKRY